MHIVIPYSPRAWTLESLHNKALEKRYRALVVHRRGGKTTGFVNHLLQQATTDPQLLADRRHLPYTTHNIEEWRRMPRLFAYIAPYLTQAKGICWDLLKYYASHIPGVQFNEAELRADLPGGGRIRLFGADNPKALRGFKFWEVGFDEYSDVDPNVFSSIVSPACIDTQAPVTFMGTIKGEDHLYELLQTKADDPDWFTYRLRASESGILAPEWLAKERSIIGDAKYNQEYELEPMAAIEGAYYVTQLSELRETKRYTDVVYEPLLPVETYWDLGMNDTMFVLFVQRDLTSIRIIDSYWAHGVPLKDIAKIIREKDYIYTTHYLPHDGKVRSMDTGEERFKSLERYLPGHKVECLPRPRSVMDKVEASRWALPRVWIDKIRCSYLMKCLAHYRQDFDEKTRQWKSEPTHDWSSHGADAFAYLSLAARAEALSGIGHGTATHEIDEFQNLAPDEFRM